MAIGACLTMGAIQLRVGLRSKPGTAHLLFALNAFVVAVYACFEMALTRADTSGKGLDEATAKHWTVVSMKNDWKTIFPVGKK